MEGTSGDQQTKSESQKSPGSQEAGPSCSKKRHYDETLEITDEIIRDQGMSKLGAIDTKEADIMNVKKPRKTKKKKLEEPKSKPKMKYSCEKCARSFAQKGRLKKHKKLECGVKTEFSCKFCGKRFKLKGSMKNHILRVHLKTNPKASKMTHNCNICARTYRSLRALNEHKREQHAAVKPQFTCDFCGFQTKRKRDLPKHITSRHLSKDRLSVPEKKYKCGKCARSFVQIGSLNKHKKFECDVIPQFRCDVCGKLFSQKGSMKIHILSVHQKTEAKVSKIKHNCDKCPRIYNSLRTLNEHKREQHAAVKPQFTCDFCGLQTKRKRYLSQHITEHHLSTGNLSLPEKKYKCEKCSRTYLQKRSLNAHKKFECGFMPQFSCEFCDKSFKLKGNMNKHIRAVHQKTKAKASKIKYTCDKCSRGYSSLIDLKSHKRTEHPLDKPQFICYYCGFHAKHKTHLSKHFTSCHLKKLHLSVTPQFLCEFCGIQFRRKSNLNSHIRSVHQKTDTKDKKQFTCDFCGYKAKRKHNLSKHIISLHLRKTVVSVPERERKYECEKCGYSFYRKEHFNRHKKKVCDVMKLFRCDLCGKKFKRKHDVYRHILGIHEKTNSKGKPQFTCDFCGYKAKRKDNLSKHIISRHLPKVSALIPEPEKKYHCERCGRSYFRKSHLNCPQRF